MITTTVLAAAGAGAVAALALVWFAFQRLQNQTRAFNQQLEVFQRQWTVAQHETVRSDENKNSLLRSEISQELQKNRVELQNGLLQTKELLEKRVAGMDEKLDLRLQDLTLGVQDKLERNLKEGFTHFEKVQEHLKFSGLQLQNLSAVGQSINDLNNLLKMPHLRGSFGEASLERLLSDLLPAQSFELQYRIVPNSTERVDAVIKYPKHLLPVDSKFPREQVLPLFESNDPVVLENARAQLSEVMRTLARQIKEKYIRPEHGTTDMALLFVPSETLYFEIIRNTKLCEALSKLRVFAVSPNTLAISLQAISVARDYYEMAKGVETTVAEIKKAQKHYDNFARRFEEIEKHLKRSSDAFDTASTHLNRYTGSVNRLIGGEVGALGEASAPDAQPDSEATSLPSPTV